MLFVKANHLAAQRRTEEAIELFQRIVTDYPDELRADNALFALAQLYEIEMADPEMAKEFYEKIFLDYSDSTFSIEARKNYRRLRGDNIQ